MFFMLHFYRFANKLLEQDKSFMNRTFTIDTNKRERMAEFNIDGKHLKSFVLEILLSNPYSRSPSRILTQIEEQ